MNSPLCISSRMISKIWILIYLLHIPTPAQHALGPRSNIKKLIKTHDLKIQASFFRELQYLRHKIHLGLFLLFGLSAFSWIITIIITGSIQTSNHFILKIIKLWKKNFEIANIFPSVISLMSTPPPFLLLNNIKSCCYSYYIIIIPLNISIYGRTGSRNWDRHVHSGDMRTPPPHRVLPHHNILLDVYWRWELN